MDDHDWLAERFEEHRSHLRAVAEQTLTFARLAPFALRGLVNGAAGVVVAPAGKPYAVMGFTVTRGRSSKSTYSPTPCASASSTWRSSTSDAQRPAASRKRRLKGPSGTRQPELTLEAVLRREHGTTNRTSR
jgi:hypothetical protein